MSFLAIQWIKIVYSDDQRGKMHAKRRARLRAHALPLPLGDGIGDDEGVLHEIRVDMCSGLDPESTACGVTLRDGALPLGDGFRVTCVERNLVLMGPYAAPTRPLFVAPLGTWGRVLWNTKDRSGGRVEYIVNAGRFDAPPRKTIFRGLATIERDLRRD